MGKAAILMMGPFYSRVRIRPHNGNEFAPAAPYKKSSKRKIMSKWALQREKVPSDVDL